MKLPLLQSSGLKIALSLPRIRNPCFRTGFNLNRYKNTPNRDTISSNRVPIPSYQAHVSKLNLLNRDTKMISCPDSLMSNQPLS